MHAFRRYFTLLKDFVGNYEKPVTNRVGAVDHDYHAGAGLKAPTIYDET